MAEISSAVTTTVFNFILLRIAGNTGVAAYGLIANLALVGAAIFNGIAQGTQPLVSESFGRGNDKEVASYLKKAVITALAFALIIVGIIYGLRITVWLFSTVNILLNLQVLLIRE